MASDKYKILIVDDNSDNLVTMKAVLKDALPSVQVILATNGKKGIELAHQEDPDVILLDIAMPGMDGFETCRYLKENERLKNIPVAFLTALRTDRASRIRALEIGAEAFLSKPCDESELIAQIRTLAKIKAANVMTRQTISHLDGLVADRTLQLEKELASNRDANEKLRQSESSLRGEMRLNRILLNSMPCLALLIHDRSYEIIASNNQAAETGAVPGICCYKSWTDRSHPCPWCLMPKVRKTGVAQQCEVEDNGIVWDLHWVPVDDDTCMHYAFDITSRRRMENQIRHTQKMEAIGQLAGGVAHDFNNILAAMMLNLSMMEPAGSRIPSLCESIRELQNDAKRAAKLTRQLLAFSHRQALRVTTLDLNQVVDNLLKMLQRLLGEHIQIDFVKAKDPSWVKADAGMIEQIVMNLCVNARDAMPSGGRLNLNIQNMFITSQQASLQLEAQPGNYVCLSVADTGSGIEEAIRAHIFEPFFTTKDVGKGTGLGLSTVYGIVKQHQGWIECESVTGKGTTFGVYLPRTEPEAESEADSVLPQPALDRGETILVVEDEIGVRKLTAQFLSRQGYKILEADSGSAALRKWEEHQGEIHLLFSDMMMPGGMSGLELAQELRSRNSEIKVVIVSGYSEELLKLDPETIPGIVFLSKPCDPALMVKTIRNCLDSN
jgi:signal transduction histidine kinase/DNA-binding response OmpR family regulator